MPYRRDRKAQSAARIKKSARLSVYAACHTTAAGATHSASTVIADPKPPRFGASIRYSKVMAAAPNPMLTHDAATAYGRPDHITTRTRVGYSG